MRLRKITFNTQIQSDSVKFNRINPGKRLMTQILEPRSEWSIDNKGSIGKVIKNRKKFVRYSGQSKTVGQKAPEKQRNLEEILDWIKEHAFQERKINIDIQLQQQKNKATVHRHLQQISSSYTKPTKPSRLHKKSITQPFFPLCSSRKRRDRTAQIPMERVQYAKCNCVIDEIYNQIAILKELGYTDSKIDAWMVSFCDSRKPFLKKILMKNVNFGMKTLKQRYCYEKDIKSVKKKIKYKVRKSKQNFSYIDYTQLLDFSRYFEEILIKKNQTRVKEVQSSIADKISNQMIPTIKETSFVYNKKEPTEVYNFVDELQHHEDLFGPFESFSKINKLRFMELNRVEQRIKQMYQGTIDLEEKRLRRGRPELYRTVTEGDMPHAN